MEALQLPLGTQEVKGPFPCHWRAWALWMLGCSLETRAGRASGVSQQEWDPGHTAGLWVSGVVWTLGVVLHDVRWGTGAQVWVPTGATYGPDSLRHGGCMGSTSWPHRGGQGWLGPGAASLLDQRGMDGAGKAWRPPAFLLQICHSNL